MLLPLPPPLVRTPCHYVDLGLIKASAFMFFILIHSHYLSLQYLESCYAAATLLLLALSMLFMRMQRSRRRTWWGGAKLPRYGPLTTLVATHVPGAGRCYICCLASLPPCPAQAVSSAYGLAACVPA